ncbi:hypothetical protein SRB5_16580 [Streptomyces sp. RB5]|uniref:HTH arsR-type domain-containing protein n=1 Tax=Streptomyces smaragdinus TaxID=2585196 RepID=A0A7K0CDI7_9ACTN|nr:helix-turn-helix domain-containing protein [Streptomyces smaragdinus]MQY11539.1 hypothetical protein [Streptomyces smaragdinus]
MAIRLHLTERDLRRITIAQRPDPLWDVEASLRSIRTRGTVKAGERRPLRLPESSRRLLSLVPAHGRSPDFISPVPQETGGDLETGLDLMLHTPRHLLAADMAAVGATRPLPAWAHDLAQGSPSALRTLAQAVREYHGAVVAPLSARLRPRFELAVADLTRTLVTEGLDALLSSLHPAIRWTPPVLHLHRGFMDDDVQLEGQGIHLMPTFFGGHDPIVYADPHAPTFVVRFTLGHPTGLQAPEAPDESLAPLVGATRAALLRVVVETGGATTTTLARTLILSPSTISHHTAALRKSGLITTQRTGASVSHTPTQLGIALLRGGEPGGPREGMVR